MVRQVVTTKDLREMCQNGVTLDDLRKLYGVYTTLEDLQRVMPSLLINDLGILPCARVATKSLSESQEKHQDGKEEEVSEEELAPGQDGMEEEMSPSEEVREEKVSVGQNEMEKKTNSSRIEKSEDALKLLSSTGQQAARKIEPELPAFYNPFLALCFLPQTSNMLDVLTSLVLRQHYFDR
jgi:hypothetical protein